MNGEPAGQATLTVGPVQVTAVCDVTADFPAPLERAFPTGVGGPGVPGATWIGTPGR